MFCKLVSGKKFKFMKEILAIIGFCAIISIKTKAQNLELGLKAGFGISNIHITNLPETVNHSDIFSSILSYSVNGTLNYKGNELLGFSIEPGFIEKGWFSYKGADHENKYTIQYLQIPILCDFYLSEKLFFSIGPEMNYLLHAENKSTYGSVEITNLNNKLELSGVIGCTYKISEDLDAGIRYSHGLTQTSDKAFWINDELDEIPSELKDYNQYLQLFIKMKLKSF